MLSYNIYYKMDNTIKIRKQFNRPAHVVDDLCAHIKFGDDPTPILKKYGFCVVEEVYTKEFSNATVNSIWDWLEGLGTGINRKDPQTWTHEKWPHHGNGLIHHTCGQEEFSWKVREHVGTIKCFSQIYGTTKLLTSFDAVNIGRPPELLPGKIEASKHSWLHTDQDLWTSDDYNNNYSIQGVANFETCERNDGGLIIGKSSHLLHNKLFEHNGKKPIDNWYRVTQEDVLFLQSQDIEFVKVDAPIGSLILFDSRAIHSGFPNQKNRIIPRFRYVTYLSLTPTFRATEKDIETKVHAIKNGLMTSHWSSCNVKIFELPIITDKECAYLTRPENIPDYEKWSDDRKRLAGLLPYD